MSDYLIHFNKNHDKLGRFATGDGDGDGKREYHDYKKLDKISDKKLYKKLKGEVRSQRAKIHGSGNRWIWSNHIGESSKKLFEEKAKKEREYENTEEYKKWISKVNALNRKGEDGTIDPDKFDKAWEELMDQQPSRNFNSFYDSVYVYGKGWTNDYIKKAGKELSLAYLEDLGYEPTKAKEYVDRLIKSGYTLGGV